MPYRHHPYAVHDAIVTRLAANNIRPDVNGYYPAAIIEEGFFPPSRTDFVWNADFTAARPVPCRWWDDTSYADAQGDPEYDDYVDPNPLDMLGDLWAGTRQERAPLATRPSSRRTH